MKLKKLTLSIIIFLFIMYLTSNSLTQAVGEGNWITGYKIENAQTEQLLAEFDSSTNQTKSFAPVLPGADIKITFDVNVMVAGEGNLKLISGLIKPQSGPYWEFVSSNYNLGSTFSPNSAQTTFNWVVGEFTMILYGKVQSSASATSTAITAVSLFGPSGGVALDKIVITPTSAEMDTYLTLLDQKNDKLQSLKDGGVDVGYIEIFENVLETSQVVANGGDVSSAIALLNGLDVSNEPASSTMQMLFLPIVGVTAALAVVFLVLFLRSRSRVSYFQLVVEDQIKDLEGLTLKAAKIDRTMSSSLESVKDRLKRLVGM